MTLLQKLLNEEGIKVKFDLEEQIVDAFLKAVTETEERENDD